MGGTNLQVRTHMAASRKVPGLKWCGGELAGSVVDFPHDSQRRTSGWWCAPAVFRSV